jgi:hypothetical protein
VPYGATEQIKNIAFFNEERILILDGTGTYKDLHPTLILLTQSPKINLDAASIETTNRSGRRI